MTMAKQKQPALMNRFTFFFLSEYQPFEARPGDLFTYPEFQIAESMNAQGVAEDYAVANVERWQYVLKPQLNPEYMGADPEEDQWIALLEAYYDREWMKQQSRAIPSATFYSQLTGVHRAMANITLDMTGNLDAPIADDGAYMRGTPVAHYEGAVLPAAEFLNQVLCNIAANGLSSRYLGRGYILDDWIEVANTVLAVYMEGWNVDKTTHEVMRGLNNRQDKFYAVQRFVDGALRGGNY